MRFELPGSERSHAGWRCWPCAAAAALLLLGSGSSQARQPLVDGDADGVDDTVDACLYTPPGVRADAHGCSDEGDEDQDRIPDVVDACPYSPAGARVDAHGCALDEDFDGVADGLDACAGTALGALVDVRGCADMARALARPGAAAVPQPVLRAVPASVPASATNPVAASAADASHAAPVVPAAATPVRRPVPPAPVPVAAKPLPAEPVPTAPAVAPGSAPVIRPANAAPVQTPDAAEAEAALRLLFTPQGLRLGQGGVQKLREALPELREALQREPRAVVLVEGYAEAGSDGAAPDTLARSRANKVRRLLAAEGIDPARLRSIGHAARAGDALLRRVVVAVTLE